MNAHPKTAALIDTIHASSPTSETAHQLILAANSLLPHFEAGQPIDAKTLRAAMEGAFGASDTSGAWVWKDAYDAAEIAQIMMITRYGALMRKQAASPAQFLSMVERLVRTGALTHATLGRQRSSAAILDPPAPRGDCCSSCRVSRN